MKKSQKYSIILLIWLLSMPFISFATAAETPDYVGINEGDTYIWNTVIDEDPLEDYVEDYYDKLGASEDIAKEYAEAAVGELGLDEDIEAIKIVILVIKEEKEFDDDVDGVRFLYNYYETEDKDANDWELEEHDRSDTLYEYDTEKYEDLIDPDPGIFIVKPEDFPLLPVPSIPQLFFGYFLATNVKWEKLVDEIDEEVRDHFEDDDEFAKAEQENNGINIFLNFDEDDYDDFESTSIYSSNGILLFFELTYDGDIIFQFEREWRYLYQYTWYIIIGAVVLLAIIICIVVKIKKR